MDLDGFKKLLEDTVKDPSLVPRADGTTYCNIALHRVAQQMGCEVFKADMLANEMFTLMATSPFFVRVDAEEANEKANACRFVVASRQANGHGHIATVYPSPEMYYSPSLKKEVPFLANVGRDNGIMPASKCFAVALGEPPYFLYQPQEV